MPASSVTVCALTYGDHYELAHRCLQSILQACPELGAGGLRVGLNDVGDHTAEYIDGLVQHKLLSPANVYRSAVNIHKYPMMRRMFYDEKNPITTPYVMWFDDDSFIVSDMIGKQPSFLERAVTALEQTGSAVVMAGSAYVIPWAQGQREWVQDQPWYRGRELPQKPAFCTGGWWLAKMAALRSLNYPWPELDHRGGDVMLGQALYQQEWRFLAYRLGVAINADADGRESKAQRRGFDQQPIGTGYVRGKPLPPRRQSLVDKLDL